jgi:hypothetical protein
LLLVTLGFLGGIRKNVIGETEKLLKWSFRRTV